MIGFSRSGRSSYGSRILVGHDARPVSSSILLPGRLFSHDPRIAVPRPTCSAALLAHQEKIGWKMSEILTEAWGHYEYSSGALRAEVSWGALTSEVVAYFTARPLDSLSLQPTPRGRVLFANGLPLADESLEALLPFVDEARARLAQQPRHPSQILFPSLQSGESRPEPVGEFRTAAESLAGLLDSERESIGVVYGYIIPSGGPLFAEPSWGGQMSGIRLPDDQHFYSVRAALGRLDLSRHDPATNRVLERKDIRFWDQIATTFGPIQICRQSVNLEPFLRELRQLVETMCHAVEGVVTIGWQGV